MTTIEKYLEKGFHKQTDFYDKYETGLPPIPFFSLSKQNQKVKKNILDGISELIDNSDFIRGNIETEFEKRMSHKLSQFSKKETDLDKNYVIACSSGTTALEVSLRSLNIGKGDEVIIPNNGWISNVGSVVSVGATPVFCDIDPETHNLSLESTRAKINKNTKAITPIHMYGNVCDVEKFKQFEIPIIEDCSQSIGATYKNHHVGLWDEDSISCYSFYPSKTLGAMGDCGMIVTTSEERADKLRAIVNYGSTEKGKYTEFPMNARASNFQLAVLLEKLPYLNSYLHGRNEIMKIYDEHLPFDLFRQPKSFNRDGCSLYVYVICPEESEYYKKRLDEENIGYSIHYPKSLVEHDIFKGYYKPIHHMPNDLQYSLEYPKRVISLPFYPEIDIDDVYRIIEVLNN